MVIALAAHAKEDYMCSQHSQYSGTCSSGHLYKATTSLLWPLPAVLNDPFTFSTICIVRPPVSNNFVWLVYGFMLPSSVQKYEKGWLTQASMLQEV